MPGSVNGPDPHMQDKMFTPTSEHSQNSMSSSDLNALQAQLHSLDTSAALQHSLAPSQTQLHINNVATINANNYKGIVELVTKPSTQCAVIQALKKAGISVADIYSTLQGKLSNETASPKLTKLADTINATIGFQPTPSNPQSMYAPLQAFFFTWGQPPDAPTQVDQLNYGTSAASRVTIQKQVNFQFGTNEMFSAAQQKSSPSELCKGRAMFQMFYTAPNMFPGCTDTPSSQKIPFDTLLAWPKSDENSTALNNASSSATQITESYHQAVDAINTGLHYLSQHNPDTLSAFQISNLGALKTSLGQMDLSSTPISVDDLSQIAHIMDDVTSGTQSL
jgi:hypothetical protein